MKKYVNVSKYKSKSQKERENGIRKIKRDYY